MTHLPVIVDPLASGGFGSSSRPSQGSSYLWCRMAGVDVKSSDRNDPS